MSCCSRIVKIVFGIHFLIVLALCSHHLFSKEKPKNKIAVRTVRLQPSIQPQVVVQGSTPAPAVKKKDPVSSSKTKPKEASQKPAKEKLPTASAQKIPAVNLSVVKELEALSSFLEEAEEKPAAFVMSPELSLPRDLPCVGSLDSFSDENYGEMLVAFLQSSLELPETGEVTVELEIDPVGHLVRLEILQTKSQKNGAFLKKRLPELDLPCFNESEKSHVVKNFTITFKNAKL